MKIEALERLLVSTLRTELATVKTQVGQTKEWIYVDFPRPDAKMPRISLTLSSSPQRPAGIGAEVGASGGTLGVYEETTFDIDIWVHRINKTTGITPKRAGTALRDYLGDQVVDVLLKKRAYLSGTISSNEIIDVEKIGEIPYPFDEETELFRKTITFTVTHLRTF